MPLVVSDEELLLSICIRVEASSPWLRLATNGVWGAEGEDQVGFVAGRFKESELPIDDESGEETDYPHGGLIVIVF
jgi:hypothetical protein